MICLLRPVSHHLLPLYRSSNLRERGHSFHLPDYDTVLFKKSFIVCSLYNLSYLTTNLFLYLLFCVLPVCYDVRLSHLNKHYLLTYLLTYLLMNTYTLLTHLVHTD